MQRLPLDKLTPGMVLAKAVVNEKGMTLCAEGAELSAVMIERLHRMDVSTVLVKGHPVDMGEELKTKDQLVEEMQARFVHVQGDPLMERIKASIAKAILDSPEEKDDEANQEGER